MTARRSVQRVARVVKRRKVVRQRRSRPAKAHLKPPNLAHAPLDLSHATYLTVPEAVAYLRFPSRNGFYMWVRRHQVPKCRRGTTLLFLRRDLDVIVQPEDRRAALMRGHRGAA